jgi:hypothetical protein
MRSSPRSARQGVPEVGSRDSDEAVIAGVLSKGVEQHGHVGGVHGASAWVSAGSTLQIAGQQLEHG